MSDYALAISSGILTGFIDSFFTGEFSFQRINQSGNKTIESFVLKAARKKGFEGESLSQAVKFLETNFPIAADQATNQFGGGFNHHLNDFTHHFSGVGLICSILTQFTGAVYGTDMTGSFQKVVLETDNPLIGSTLTQKIQLGIINWIYHMFSDMAGSSLSIAKGTLGTGVPGPIVSLIKELSALPVFTYPNENGQSELSLLIRDLFFAGNSNTGNKPVFLSSEKFDLRTEAGLGNMLKEQAIPVLINETIVKTFYILKSLIRLIKDRIRTKQKITKSDLAEVFKTNTRTYNQMKLVADLTFTTMDLTDAAVRAAVESGGNTILFGGKFVARCNLIGASRLALSVCREASADQIELQLLTEKRILTEKRAALYFDQLQEFKQKLNDLVLSDLRDEITEDIKGIQWIDTGLNTEDSDLTIQGCVLIQQRFQGEIQFESRDDFDQLMDSDESLML